MEAQSFDFLIWLHCGSLDREQLLLNFAITYIINCSTYNKHTPATHAIFIDYIFQKSLAVLIINCTLYRVIAYILMAQSNNNDNDNI